MTTKPGLYLVATSLAENVEDLSERARKRLREAQLVIGEEWKPLLTLARAVGRTPSESRAEFSLLNEHSSNDDLEALTNRVAEIVKAGGSVALVSDCGTPGFCDPGADLVDRLRIRGVRVSADLGPSALMGLISLSGVRLDQFWFMGFPSQSTDVRRADLERAMAYQGAVILMDTPYRLMKLISELTALNPKRGAVLALRLSADDEDIISAPLNELQSNLERRPADQVKLEFMLLLKPISDLNANDRFVPGFSARNIKPRRDDRKAEQQVRRGPGGPTKNTTQKAKHLKHRSD